MTSDSHTPEQRVPDVQSLERPDSGQYEFDSRTAPSNVMPSNVMLICEEASELTSEAMVCEEMQLARSFFAKAYARYEQATALAETKRDKSNVVNDWGAALVAEAQRVKGHDRETLLDRAINKYKEAAAIDPTNPYPCGNWADALKEKASTKDLADALELFEKAYPLYEQAASAATTEREKSNVLNAWGAALLAESQRVKGDKRESLMDRAMEKYKLATDIDASNPSPWWTWGDALARRGVRGRALATDLYVQARDNYAMAAKLASSADDRARLWEGWAWHVEQFATRDKQSSASFVDHAADRLRRSLQENAEGLSSTLFSLGNLLREADRLDEAIEVFREGAEMQFADDFSIFCQHNLASLLESQGLFDQARAQWRVTRRMYAGYVSEHHPEPTNRDVWEYYGSILFDGFGELEEATQHLSTAITAGSSREPYIAVMLSKVFKEQAEIDVSFRPQLYSQAKSAERAIETSPLPADEREPLLGEVALLTDDYQLAEKWLTEAVKSNPWNYDAQRALGLSLLRQKKYREARAALEEALRLSPRDFSIWSYLGEALAKCGEVDAAEQNFERILSISNGHLDAHIGLAELAIALGDETGDTENYERAIAHLNEVVDLCTRSRGSRRLTPKERAQIYYSRGYSQIKLNAIEGRYGFSERMSSAMHDFGAALKMDRFHQKARIARNKLRAIGREPEALKKWASVLVCGVAGIIFLLAQLSFWPPPDFRYEIGGYQLELRQIDGVSHFALTFGSLAFLIMGMFLPRLLKLKVAGIEIERSQLEVGGSANVSLRR